MWKTEYVQFNLDTPLTFPGNNQTQDKSGVKFTVKDRDNFYDWYNAMWLPTLNQYTQQKYDSQICWKKMFTMPLTFTSWLSLSKPLLEFADDFSKSEGKN